MGEKSTRTSRLAIASLVCGVLFFIPFFNIIFEILAIIFGISALKAISKYKNELIGKGLAIAGIILGAVIIALFILGLTVALVFPNLRNILKQ